MIMRHVDIEGGDITRLLVLLLALQLTPYPQQFAVSLLSGDAVS